MITKKQVQEYQEKLEQILLDNEAKELFRNKIDQFPIEKINDLTNYWNQSLKNFSDKLHDFLKDIQYDENGDVVTSEKIDFEHNAAKKDNKYVKPFVNKLQENYLNIRQDANYDVLNDYTKMDFTISESVIQDINKCITRLIMPRYRRKSEIEDLDRNFWVIGQNLSLLNKLIFDLEDIFGEDLIAELCGLWDNVYRLWQAIFGLIELTDNINTNEKVRIILKVPSNGYKSAVNNNIIYFSYNEILKDIIGKTNEEIINNYHINDTNNLIQIDCNKETQVNLSKFFKMVLEKNFVILKNTNSDKQIIYDILSLNFTDRPNFTLNGYTWYKKTIKIEHLWIDFICDNGYIYTYTDNNFGNQEKLLNYDFNISIPMYINNSSTKFSYYDAIRINKPIPYLGDKQDERTYAVHMLFFNDGNDWVYKDNNSSIFFDGFYGLDFSNYPDNKIINTENNSYFKFSDNELFNIKISSSDLIDCRHSIEGQTYIENNYINVFTEQNFTTNLRYLTGRHKNQEIEIITSKDTILSPFRINPQIEAKETLIGRIGFTGTIVNTSNGEEVIRDEYYLCLNYYCTDTDDKLYKDYGQRPDKWRGTEENSDGKIKYLWYPLTDAKFVNDKHIIEPKKLREDICGKIILENLKNTMSNSLKNYEFQVRVLSVNTVPWWDGTDHEMKAPGKKYLFLCVIYKINDNVKIDILCDLGYSFNFFGESEVEKELLENLQRELGTNEGLAYAYCYWYKRLGHIYGIQHISWLLNGLEEAIFTPNFELPEQITVIITNGGTNTYPKTAEVKCSLNTQTGELIVEESQYYHLNGYTLEEPTYSLANAKNSDKKIYIGKQTEKGMIEIEDTGIDFPNRVTFWNTSHVDFDE